MEVSQKHGRPTVGQLAAALKKEIGLDLDAQGMADILWLAEKIEPGQTIGETIEKPIEKNTLKNTPEELSPQPERTSPTTKSSPEPPAADVYPEEQRKRSPSTGAKGDSIPFRSPAAPALRSPLELGRALRPLMRKVRSLTKTVLDEEATVNRIAESDLSNFWLPVLVPDRERWLDLALVVEESPSTFIWKRTIAELQRLLTYQGAFRTVRTWRLAAVQDKAVQDKAPVLLPHWDASGDRSTRVKNFRSPKELIDPAGRRLILLVSDCTSELWRRGRIHPILKLWANSGPTTILHLLPERLRSSSALGYGFPVSLRAFLPGVPSDRLIAEDLPIWEDLDRVPTLTLPVISLEPEALSQWSRVVAGVGAARTTGVVFDLDFIKKSAQSPAAEGTAPLSAEARLNRFWATASKTARKLAGLMAAAPVSLPVIDLLRETLLPDARQGHIAEIFMSGLIEQKQDGYDFIDGVRERLIDATPVPDSEAVLDAVSRYVGDRAGLSIRSFPALLELSLDDNDATLRDVLPFARLGIEVLRRLGAEHRNLARRFEESRSEATQGDRVDTRNEPESQRPSEPKTNFWKDLIPNIRANVRNLPRLGQRSREIRPQSSVEPPSEKSINYARLRDLLEAGEWDKADEETARKMLEAVNRGRFGWWREENIDNFPGEDLRTIDRLWVEYSDGHFGFSVQARIYEKLGGTGEYNGEIWRAFGDRVGWRNGERLGWADKRSITYLEEAPEAHLPLRIALEYFTPMGRWLSSLAQRLAACRIT